MVHLNLRERSYRCVGYENMFSGDFIANNVDIKKKNNTFGELPTYE